MFIDQGSKSISVTTVSPAKSWTSLFFSTQKLIKSSFETVYYANSDFSLSCLCDQTAFMDLVDVFAVPSDPLPSDQRWNNAPHQAGAGAVGTDPWDSMGEL